MEIEAKILEIDADRVGRTLAALGAVKHFDGTHEAYSFDDGHLKKNGCLLRLRRERQSGGETVTMTFKRLVRTEVTKQAEEAEVSVSSFGNARRIIEGVGFRSVKVVRKRRVEYVLGKTHFCLDTIRGAPTYLEIEAPTQARVVAAAVKLGYKKDRLRPWTVIDVMKHYGLRPQKK